MAGVHVDGKAKYTGLHALRHFYASWCINRPTEGGLGLPPKVVQERLGHSSITMTYDRYGHLFPRGDDAKELDEAERALSHERDINATCWTKIAKISQKSHKRRNYNPRVGGSSPSSATTVIIRFFSSAGSPSAGRRRTLGSP